jgi:hypothetical protein
MLCRSVSLLHDDTASRCCSASSLSHAVCYSLDLSASNNDDRQQTTDPRLLSGYSNHVSSGIGHSNENDGRGNKRRRGRGTEMAWPGETTNDGTTTNVDRVMASSWGVLDE